VVLGYQLYSVGLDEFGLYVNFLCSALIAVQWDKPNSLLTWSLRECLLRCKVMFNGIRAGISGNYLALVLVWLNTVTYNSHQW